MNGDQRGGAVTSGSGGPGPLTRLLLEVARAPAEEVSAAWKEELLPGTRVGRFEIRREIGRGGFGAVYEAFDPELGRDVALKALRPRRGGRPISPEMIKLEAEAVAKLNHPNIVTLFDVGSCPAGPYLVMELLRGQTLADRLVQGALPLDEALRVADELARGLAHAHQHGVIHRDLKPANAYLCEDGSVKILDFGLAHLLGSEGSSEGGTPGFMAPEQARGEHVDERADVYALGTVLYQLLTGRLPWDPKGERGVPSGGQPPEVPKAPAALMRILGRMLARDPAERMANGQEAHAALTALRKSREPHRRAWAAWSLAVVAVVAAVVIALKPPKLPPGRLRVAVADLDNRSGDPGLDGAGELFQAALEQSRRVSLMTRAGLVGLLREGGRPVPKAIGEAEALAAARKAQAQLVLVPSIRPAGNGFELAVQAVNVARNEALFGAREQMAAAASVYAAIDRLAIRVRRALAEDPGEAPQAPVTAVEMAPADPEALRLYAEGKRRQSEGNYGEAGELILQAAAADPEFMLPRLDIVQSSGSRIFLTPIQGLGARALAGHVDALRRNLHRLPAGDRAYAEHAILVTEGGYENSTDLLAALDRLIEARPEDPRPYVEAGAELVLYRGDLEAARPYVDKAAALSPPEGLGDVLDFLVLSDRLDEALVLARRWAAQSPSPSPLLNLAYVHLARGELPEALALVRATREAGLDGAGIFLAADAPEEFEALASGDPALPWNWLVFRGRVREALARLDQSMARGEASTRPGGGHLQRAIMLMPRGDLAAVRSEVEAHARLRGSLPEHALLLAEMGHPELPERIGGRPSPDHALGYRMVRAIRTWKGGDREKALRDFATICAPSSHLHQGEILAELGRDREAVEAYRRFRRLLGANQSMADAGLNRFHYPRSLHLEAAALERLGDLDGARRMNARLLHLWEHADADLPLLAEAKAMRARLAVP